jgi:spermidine synthase
MSEHRFRLAALGAVVFISSALVLVIEILAARLIAPFVGVSLYSWTAIIGVVLAGLSLGNWLGGVWADRGGAERAAGLTLAAAGLSAFVILLILPRLAGPLQAADLSLASTSLVLAGALFFVPAALLGVVTPLLTTVALRDADRPGHIVGLMHALAALGSILGTFATGFWLVQWIGSRDLVLATGALLLLLALPLLRGPREMAVAVTAGLGLGLLSTAYGYADPCHRESNYFCVRVVDSSGDAPFGNARSMVLDHLIHSTNHEQVPELLLAPYIHLMDELMLGHVGERTGASYFFAGGGAYTLPRAVRARDPDARIVVAELDPVVTDVARQDMYLDPVGMDIRHTDARAALLRDSGGHYDVVIGDVFHDIAVPYHLLTREFAALVHRRLSDDGMYVMNVVDAFPDARLVKAVYKTLKEEFPQVEIWIDELPQFPTRLTYVISAHKSPCAVRDNLSAKQGLPRRWHRVTEPALKAGLALEQVPMLTDDLAPVERLLARLFLSAEGR